MNWNILTAFEKHLILNLLPQVRIKYKYIEARNLFVPKEGNYCLHSTLFGEYDDFTYTYPKIGISKSQKLRGIEAWNSIALFHDDLMSQEPEYNSVQKRLLAIWGIEAISKFYFEIAKLYFYQNSYPNKEELSKMVKLILDHIHTELSKFQIDPNTKSLLSYMDVTVIYYTNVDVTCAHYDAILDKIEQYATDSYAIYPFAPRPD